MYDDFLNCTLGDDLGKKSSLNPLQKMEFFGLKFGIW